jgi:Ni,Fe-hydrogenase maturation factor
MSPGTLLRLVRETCGSAPFAWLVRVSARDFGFGAPLSAPVAAAVPRAVETIRDIIESRKDASGLPT